LTKELRKVDIKDYSSISELFSHFEGVDIGDTNSLQLLTNWGIMMKGIILYSTIYPMALRDEETLTDVRPTCP